jgi:hypothetical protein
VTPALQPTHFDAERPHRVANRSCSPNNAPTLSFLGGPDSPTEDYTPRKGKSAGVQVFGLDPRADAISGCLRARTC